MSDVKSSTYCNGCKKQLVSNSQAPCPYCGSLKKDQRVEVEELVLVSDAGGVLLKTRKEYYNENPILKWIVIIITLVAVFIGAVGGGLVGLIFGLILGIISYFLSPFVREKIIEIHESQT